MPCIIEDILITKNTGAVDILLLKLRVTWSISVIHCNVVLQRAQKPNWYALTLQCRSQYLIPEGFKSHAAVVRI
jgi:hypothetical protein